MTTSKFKKNPVEIEAIQFTGDNVNDIWDAFGAGEVYGPTEKNPDWLIIATLEGDMKANVGDWIIKGIKGELYPCKPDIFDASYSRVDPDIHTGDTITKVYHAIWDAMEMDKQNPDSEKLTLSQNIVSQMQNAGILFRERESDG